MTLGIVENPLRKEVHNSPYYSKLLNLDSEWMKKVEGTDADWLINTNTTTKPDKLPDSEVYQSLEAENEELWKTLQLINEGWLQNKLWLDSVENEKEAEEATINLLKAVVLYWRTYLESDDKEIFKKMPVLGARLSKHENRVKAFDLITLMDKVLYKEITIEKLLIEWHGGKTWDDYNKKYDFDNSLWAFVQLLDLKKKYQAQKQEAQSQEKNLVDKLSEKVKDLELELKGEKQMSKAEISNLLKKVEALKLVIKKSQEEPAQRSIEEITQDIPGAFPK